MQNAKTILNIFSYEKVKSLVLIFFFVFLTGVGGLIQFPLPFTQVPITLQTFFVLLAGVYLGRNKGAISQSLYLVLGGIGMPLFAGATYGFIALFGPTGGYLIGFVFVAAFVGQFIRKVEHSYLRTLLLMLVASLLVFIPGVIQLAAYTGFSIKKAIIWGFLPFIPGDIIKCAVAAFVVRARKKF